MPGTADDPTPDREGSERDRDEAQSTTRELVVKLLVEAILLDMGKEIIGWLYDLIVSRP